MLNPLRSKLSSITFVTVVLTLSFACGIRYAKGTSAPRLDLAQNLPQIEPATIIQSYQGLFELSQKEKRGLMFFMKGQTIGGAVTKVIGNEAVEVRNQTYSRIIIRLDQIDAVAMN